MRGANQSLVGLSAGRGASSAGASAPAWPPGRSWPPGAGGPGRSTAGSGAAVSPVPASPSLSATGVRMTTGGMGRDPGMLIRIRVVSVVSVFRSASPRPSAAGPRSSAPPAADAPYGGVPEG
ncbi:hypothetical protein C0R01_09530 [Streptomyces albidoflavus]|nr:hypothetical protein C0R00_09680 [Streptomyces albidoflavus]RZE81334.1 hypothetical protein C0R01_09530 [Streptomyces albidoflavus]